MSVVLSVSTIARRYGALRAVDGVDLELRTGERRALIGPNGAGKSTLLALLAGTERPSSGSIVLRGRDVTRLGAARRARLGLARTFQTPAYWRSLSVGESLLLGAWRAEPARLRWLAPSTVARRAAAHLDALALTVDPAARVDTLSHGQQRLLEIAVAIAARPELLLLDEPAAGLSDDETAALLAALRRLPRSLTMLLVEHNQDFVSAYADGVTVLHAGRVLASGRPAEIRADPAVREVYLGTPAGGSRR